MFSFCQQLREVFKICVIVFITIQLNNKMTCFIRDRVSRFAASVAMNKISFTLFPVTFQHTIDMTYRAAQGKSSPLFVWHWVICQ